LELERIIRAALLVPAVGDPSTTECLWGLPLLLLGDPGIGKTTRMRAACASIGLAPFETVIGATRNAEDYGGVPVADGKGGMNVLPMLPPALKLHAAGVGCLFLDEMNSASASVQAAQLRVVDERVVGDMFLGGRVRVVGAMNPPSSAAAARELPPALANRFCHVEVDSPRGADWIGWVWGATASDTLPTITDGEARVISAWPKAWARARGIVTGYVKSKDSALYRLPEIGNPDRSKAWASPRTWERAMRAIATVEALDETAALRDTLVQGCLGHAASVELAAYIKAVDLPDPEVLLGTPSMWVPDTKRLDRTMAVLGSVAAFVESRWKADEGKDSAPRRALWEAAWFLMAAAVEAGITDVVAFPARTLLLLDKPGATRNKHGQQVLGRLQSTGIISALLRAA
jgi:MoxR-like ATPase